MEADCVILGLLQNQWVKDPARVEVILSRHDAAFRRRYLGALLFFGSLTGKRLRAAFGDWCERIVWENASPIIASHASANPAPDLAYVSQTMNDVHPEIVLAFGRRAQWALKRVGWEGRIIPGPHPAARNTNVGARLAAMCKQLKGTVDEDQS